MKTDLSEKVERYYAEEHPFKKGIGTLRELALKSKLEETYKWMFPTYMIHGKNVLSICKFKNHFGIWFFKGVFLSDPEKVLENAQKGKTQAMRHWKFYPGDPIDPKKVLGYMNEAIAIEKKGIKLAPKKKSRVELAIPHELKEALGRDKAAELAFQELSDYKKKEYCEYIANAKRAQTKITRLEKVLPMIVEGRGLNDRYR